jgi:hypothetical protein
MSESRIDPEPGAVATPRAIPLVVKPVLIQIRAYIGTSYGGYEMTYYRVDLVCRSEAAWRAGPRGMKAATTRALPLHSGSMLASTLPLLRYLRTGHLTNRSYRLAGHADEHTGAGLGCSMASGWSRIGRDWPCELRPRARLSRPSRLDLLADACRTRAVRPVSRIDPARRLRKSRSPNRRQEALDP